MKDQDKQQSSNDGYSKKPAKEGATTTTTESEEQHHVTGVEESTSSNANQRRKRQQQQQEQDLQKLMEVTKASTTVSSAAASATRRPNSANWTVSAALAANNASTTNENLLPVPRKKSSMLQKQKDNRSTRSITTDDLPPPARPPVQSNRTMQLQKQKSSRSTRSITTGDLKSVAMGVPPTVSSSRTMTMTGSIIHSAYQHSVISDDGAIATVSAGDSRNNGSASMMTASEISFNDSLPTQDDTLLPQPGSSRNNFNDSLPTQGGDDTLLPQPGSSRNWSSSRNFLGSSAAGLNSSAAGSEFAVPGAIAIAGIDARQNGTDIDDLEDDIIVTSGEADNVLREQEQQLPEQHPREHLVEALPITGDDEDYLHALKDGDEEQGSKPVDSNIVAARPVVQRENKSNGLIGWIKRHKLLATTTILVFIAVILTSVLGTDKDKTNKDNKSGFGALKLSKRFKQALPIITNITSEEILYDTRTPQYKALLWLADYDKAQLDFSTMSTSGSSILVMEGGNKPRILQRYILAVLFFATQGQYWNNTYGFLSEWDECQWAAYDSKGDVAGVSSCNGDGLVTSLLLTENNLNGTLPEEIGSLESLVVLRVGTNPWLYGSLPSSLSSMSNLRELTAYRCSFMGQMPQEIGRLTGLTYMAINENRLSGTVPTSIGQLTLLDELYMYNNQLDGTIPLELGNLINLRIVAFQHNQLIGSIPNTLSNLQQLKHVDFSYNNLNDGASNLCRIDTLLLYVTDCYSQSFPTTINKEILCPCCTLCCSEQADTCQLN